MFANKGRIKLGADADITVFDPNTVLDKATFDDPLQFSAGISYVLVNGVVVIKEGKTVEGVFPGRAARASISPRNLN
jgi:N-acyl-D-aspartate/D-glutamate deacylase